MKGVGLPVVPESNDIPDNQMSAVSMTDDYSRVLKPARVAIYDDPLIAPRVITVEPAPTTQFIQNLAVAVHEQSQRMGGRISYTVILEVTENFIHAQFKEIVVSILDGGNTIRFTDQGPGISDIGKAILPGFTSAIEPMKSYIRGVGSGLPIVHDWMELKNGHITIESNIGNGAAVTISLIQEKRPTSDVARDLIAGLTEKERLVLEGFLDGVDKGVTDLSKITGLGVSGVHYQLGKLEDLGLVVAAPQKKRALTPLGWEVMNGLQEE